MDLDWTGSFQLNPFHTLIITRNEKYYDRDVFTEMLLEWDKLESRSAAKLRIVSRLE